jgi:plastocyanin
MAWGPHPGGMFAWHRWKLGWLDPDQIACFSGRGQIEATIAPIGRPGGTKAIVFRGSRSAYVAEVRQPIGEDSAICKKGVLIYAVDFQTPAGQADIRLIPALGDPTDLLRRCGPHAAAPHDIGAGEVSRVSAFGFRFELLEALADGSYRIRVTRAPARSAEPAASRTIRVEAKEMKFALSASSAPRGTVVFVVRNTGKLVHDFKIAGRKTPLIRPGKTARLGVTFTRRGKYRYVCTVRGHAAAGMKGTFTVR